MIIMEHDTGQDTLLPHFYVFLCKRAINYQVEGKAKGQLRSNTLFRIAPSNPKSGLSEDCQMIAEGLEYN